MEKKIMIIGAGPTGIGAGCTLERMGYRNWEIHEQQTRVGGLSASIVDGVGFTWDLGGHVLFTRYPEFERTVDSALAGRLNVHVRDAWIHMCRRWIPYPLQNHLRYLPNAMMVECLLGFLFNGKGRRPATDFHQWINNTFGKGLARHFMIPYNRKVWTCRLEKMGYNWIEDRVSVVDFRSSLRHVCFGRNSRNWGPNNDFKYPSSGGTGEIFRCLAVPLKPRLKTQSKVDWIDPEAKSIGFSSGETRHYDRLISTMPLDRLVEKIKGAPEPVTAAAKRLRYNRVLVVGMGFERKDDNRRSWVYFPERAHPYYRVTYLSNYADANVPDIRKHFSLLAEIAFRPEENISETAVVNATLKGFEAAGMIARSDTDRVRTIFTHEIDHAYPIPTLDRDENLKDIHTYLEENRIYARGRFGAWRYESGNMDHCFLQGKEIVERLLLGRPERIVDTTQ